MSMRKVKLLLLLQIFLILDYIDESCIIILNLAFTHISDCK